MLIAGVVGDEVDDELHVPGMEGCDQPIDIIEGATQIRLRRRGIETAAVAASGAPAYAPAPVAAVSVSAAAPRLEPAAPISEGPSGVVIESPMVGTFYSSPAPEAPPFVNVGSVVRPETIVCVIEAMKVFTDIPAGVSGTTPYFFSQTA